MSVAREKLTDYEKQTRQLRKDISSIQEKIEKLNHQLYEKKRALRDLNLKHNAPVIQSMSQILLDASDNIDLQSLMQQTDFKSAFEAFLRAEKEKNTSQKLARGSAKPKNMKPNDENSKTDASNPSEKLSVSHSDDTQSAGEEVENSSLEETQVEQEAATNKEENTEHREDSSVENTVNGASDDVDTSSDSKENSGFGKASYYWEPPKVFDNAS